MRTSKRIQLLGERLRIAGKEVERAREQGRPDEAAKWERRYDDTLKELNDEINSKGSNFEPKTH